MLLNEGVHLACRMVAIYDSRCLKKTKSKAVSQLHGHSLSISSAYFSPCTGNRVLTTCLDNHLRWRRLSILEIYVTVAVCSPSSMSLPVSIHRIYDTSEMTSKSPLLTSIRYILPCSGLASLLCAPRLVEPGLDLIHFSFSGTTCRPVAGWPNYQQCGTPNRRTVLWWGAWRNPGGCRCSTKTVSFSTPS